VESVEASAQQQWSGGVDETTLRSINEQGVLRFFNWTQTDFKGGPMFPNGLERPST
jgi:hypothetical protein